MHPVIAEPVQGSRLRASLTLRVQDLRGHRLPWLAMAFGLGVGLYFALPAEPGALWLVLLAATIGVLLCIAWIWRAEAGFLAVMIAAIGCGLGAGAVRTIFVSGPVLDFRYYGAVEGRVVLIDRSSSGADRITLDHVRLDGVAPARTPNRVRLSLHGEDGPRSFLPGQIVMTTAHLSAPGGPAEPYGFDFGRHAWFQGLGAVGYTRVPVMLAAQAEGGAGLLIQRLRTHVAEGLRERMPGARGEVAAAITTGDRSGLPEDVVEALRISNLAHLLAISGLHMGLLVGFVFWVTRGGLTLWPQVALTYPIRTWAAVVALPFAVFYLFLSGGSVATQRAFVMAVVMLGAVMLGRRALSLRSVAIAAILVLLWRPESLTGPGFQMSFAATAALVIAFRAMSDWGLRSDKGNWLRGWRGAVVSLLVSSIVAGVATAPFAAAHFNRVGQLGVLANVLAVPAMGAWVMPLLLVGLLLWPLGLEALPLWLAGHGIGWIISVAEWVAGLPNASRMVKAPDPMVLPLIGVAMTLLATFRGRGRLVGLAGLVLSFGLWAKSDRPDILILGDGRLVGIMTADGRALSRDSGAGFVAEIWLENDGDAATQTVAATRMDDAMHRGLPQVFALRGKTGLDIALADCDRVGGWLVTPVKVESDIGGCRVFSEDSLRQSGAIAVWVEEDGALRIVTAAEHRGLRPWTPAGREDAGQKR